MPEQRARAARLRQYVWVALALLVAIAIGAAVAWRQQQHTNSGAPTVPTLIVLPLHPDGARHDEGVLAENLSAELIPQLARIEGVRLIAKASALRADADHLDAPQLARRVGVSHALEGRLRELGGDQLHVELRLYTVPDDRTLWSKAYDRKLADVAALERDIAQAVAQALTLPIARAGAKPAAVDPTVYREYAEARRLAESPQRARGLDLLRALVAKAPNDARAHAALARSLASDRPSPGAYDEAAHEAEVALELVPDLAEAHAAQAILACHGGDWARCTDSFQRALTLDASDAACRIGYAYWLSGLGYTERALRESETAWLADPLSYDANFLRARLLDTTGRHNEALDYLDAATPQAGGLIYARWHNAVWRDDLKTASSLAAAMPRSDGFRESYIVVTEALGEPRLWPQALPLIGTSERANGGINVLRIMMPNPDYGIVIVGLEKMLRDGWPSYYMLLWMPEYAAMRHDPAFQDFLKRTRLLEYWREHGFPAQCHADGDGAACN